jgi:hypothetical protein
MSSRKTLNLSGNHTGFTQTNISIRELIDHRDKRIPELIHNINKSINNIPTPYDAIKAMLVELKSLIPKNVKNIYDIYNLPYDLEKRLDRRDTFENLSNRYGSSPNSSPGSRGSSGYGSGGISGGGKSKKQKSKKTKKVKKQKKLKSARK